MAKHNLETALKNRAKEVGFDLCRLTTAQLPLGIGEGLEQFLQSGHHASMTWMDNTRERRKSPQAMWEDAQSAIILGVNYGPETDPLENLAQKQTANISVYARNRDYHDLVKGRLKTLAGWVASITKQDVKVFVDTAPLMEKPLAAQAGLGWQGKHTNLVSREFGSWVFLGVILTTAKLQPDAAEIDHCGSCHACLDICPTNAFPAPYKLDARRCISYLTIEHDGPIPVEFRKSMGNRIYGCDDCLAACPWNKFAQTTHEAKLIARQALNAPSLEELAGLDDTAFRAFFSGSPIKRIGRNRFIRNVLIAIGNSENQTLADSALTHLADPDSMVRGAAVWALSQLLDPNSFEMLREQHISSETNEIVHKEWTANAT